MLELLRVERSSPAEATQRCRYALARRWRGFHLASFVLPRDDRSDWIAVLAWHALVRHAFDVARRERAVEETRTDLRHAIDDAFSDDPASPIATALRPAVLRHRLSALTFHGPLDEHARKEAVRTFTTRRELLQHAGRLTHPEARHLLQLADLRTERQELLALALAEGLQVIDWLRTLPRDLERGHVHIAMEDLERHRVDLLALRGGEPTDAMRRLIADQIGFARSLLEKGWELCTDLGHVRGRELAFVLRWHAAELSAIEARKHALGRAGSADEAKRSGGALRLAACLATAVLRRGAPF